MRAMRLALAAGALVIVAAACGGIEHEPNLAKAVDRTTASGSSRIAVRGQDGGPAASNAYVCEGVADYARRRVEISCTLGGEPFMNMRAVDGHVYFDEPGGSDKWWVAPDDSESPLGEFSPEKLLSMLRAASSEIIRVGEEDVRGASTARYRLTVDRERADLGDGPGPTAEVDVWIDEDGFVRRIDADDESGEFTVEFFDFGIGLDIRAPPPDRITELDELITPQPCTPGGERPVRVEQAVEALGANGFAVDRDHEGCKAGVAAVLATREELSERDPDAVIHEQGYLLCFVLADPDGTAFSTVPDAATGAQRAVRRSLENLACSLTVEGPRAEANVERLDRALGELERAIRP